MKLEAKIGQVSAQQSGVLLSVVSESRFFNLETRMRVSPIQSRSSRRDREFLTLTLRLRDETEKKFPPISGIETRSRFIIFTLRLRDENENSLDLISFFETRPRILKLDQLHVSYRPGSHLPSFLCQNICCFVALDHSFFSLHPLFCND